MIGTTISHYRILSQLGAGGMGEVYLAEDTRLGHKVAIKRLPENAIADRDLRARFEREARAVAHLSHPNILTLHEFDEIDGSLFFIMEYAAGGSLAELARKSPGGIDVDRVLEWGSQAAEGLAAAHTSGILHRDIKPANLLLTRDGGLRVADFGLARSAADTQITQAGAIVGTLAFMSPEQLAGQEADERSDVFSLGATLVELLIGRRDGSGGTLYANPESGIAALRSSRSDLPPELITCLLASLETIPANRLSSAGDFARQLRTIQSMRSSNPTASLTPVSGRNRRVPGWRVWIAALATASVLIIGNQFFGSGSDSGMPRTVAVLPLRDISPNGDQRALADGLTEAITADIGRIHSLSVISRMSSATAASSSLTMQEIGERLNADAILDASVMREGNRIRLQATLVDARRDRNLWTTTFEHELTDIMSLQRQVALRIAEGLRARLSAAESRALQSSYNVDPDAFERYVQARSLWRDRTSDGLSRSVAIYRELVEEQPEFAEAWIGLADALIVLPSYVDASPKNTYVEARRCALRAIELDPSDAAAWNVLAELAWTHDYDYQESERLRKKSLELNPNAATTHQWYAEFLTAMGRHDEALDEIAIAQRLDPLTPLMFTLQTSILVYARRFDEAIQNMDAALQRFPNSDLAVSQQEWVLRRTGKQLDRAFAVYIEKQRRGGRPADQIESIRNAFAAEGFDAVDRLYQQEQLDKVSRGEFVRPRWIAESFAWTRDRNECLDWLERSYQEGDIALLRLKVQNIFDFLRDDPQFQDILRRINLSSGV